MAKREDLQGIRALAILSVLGFHFFPKLFPNGYVGVDMFFVLSGFLMTMIFGSKTISWATIGNFYFRRAKRIFPLYLLIILIGSLSIFLIFPTTFLSLNMESAWKSIMGYKNFGGEDSEQNLYFLMLNQASDIFTHTWSLCVEMQFYLLVPLIFWILSKFQTVHHDLDQKFILYYHLGLIFLSLAYQLLSVEQVAFNSVFSRIWQFLTGSGAFFLSQWLINIDNHDPQLSEATGLLEPGLWEIDLFDKEDEIVIFRKSSKGPMRNLDRYQFLITLSLGLISLIGLSMWMYSIPAQWLRVLVTFFTALVIVAGTICESNPLTHRSLVYIGDISYSLYLVHWPIFVYVKTYYEDQLGVYLIAIAGSFLSAIVISESFEKWYLKLEKKGIYVLITVFFLVIIAVIINQTKIANSIDNIRFASDNKVFEDYMKKPNNPTLGQSIVINRKWARDEFKNLIIPNCLPNISEHGFCEFDKSQLVNGTLKMFLVGNSYAPNFGGLVFETFGRRYAAKMAKFSRSRCQVLVAGDANCKKAHGEYFEEVKKYQPDVLFILERPISMFQPILGPMEDDQIFQEALTTLLLYQSVVTRKIYLLKAISPSPSPSLTKFSKLLETTHGNVTNSVFEVDLTYKNAVERQRKLVERCTKCQLIPISEVFHGPSTMKMFDLDTKLGYFYNGLHLTPAGLNMVRPVFQKALESFSL